MRIDGEKEHTVDGLEVVEARGACHGCETGCDGGWVDAVVGGGGGSEEQEVSHQRSMMNLTGSTTVISSLRTASVSETQVKLDCPVLLLFIMPCYHRDFGDREEGKWRHLLSTSPSAFWTLGPWDAAPS
jgi:hypothetical protein